MKPPAGRRSFAAAVLAAVVLIGEPVTAQTTAAAPELKAAYVYNFARFVEWPADVLPVGTPLTLCVVNDNTVADALERTVKVRTVNGHELTVSRLTAGASLQRCQVLYIGGSDLKRSLEVIGTVKGSCVLTVSDAARFSQTGGIAELFLEDGRMRIAVNVDAMQRARVHLSSRVLALAKIVRDTPAP